MEPNKEFVNLILARHSCKVYKPDPVDTDTLTAIVETARYAPSGMNRQMCHFYVITAPKLLSAITALVSRKLPPFAERDCRFGAPALVVVANRKDNTSAVQDSSCAMENMMLAGCALGVASRWCNQLTALSDDPDLRALLAPIGLNDEERICGSLALGYPDGPLFPDRPERKGNFVTWVTGE